MSKGETIRTGNSTIQYVAANNRGEVVVDVLSSEPFRHITLNGRERLLNQMKTASCVKKLIDNRR